MKQILKILITLIAFNSSSPANAEVTAIYDFQGTKNDNDIYIGEVNSEGYLHGYGIYISEQGDEYIGRFIDGKLSGYGTKKIKLKDGSFNTYRGQNNKWEFDGYGVYYWSSLYYLGKFKAGKSNAFNNNCGVRKYNNGEVEGYYCFENGKWQKLSILNYNKNKLAKKNSKKAQAALSIANTTTNQAYKVYNTYINQWPYARLDRKTLCQRATDLNGRWEKATKYKNHIKEAKKRSLNEKVCSSLTGRALKNGPISWGSPGGSDQIEKCFLGFCVSEDQVIPIWVGFFVFLIVTILIIRKILSVKSANHAINLKAKTINRAKVFDEKPFEIKSKTATEKKSTDTKFNEFHTKKVEDKLDINIIKKDKKSILPSEETTIATNIVEKHLSLKEDIPTKIEPKDSADEIISKKTDSDILKGPTQEKKEMKVKQNNTLKIDEDQIKENTIIDKKSAPKDTNKKEMNKMSILDPTETRTKVCVFCETENFGSNTHCLICNKILP